MDGWQNEKPVPRHCDPRRFGMSTPDGWRPFVGHIHSIRCACGRAQRCAIGVLPGDGEEDRLDTAIALCEAKEQGPCLSCRPSKARDHWGRGAKGQNEGSAASGTGASSSPPSSEPDRSPKQEYREQRQLAKAWERAEAAEQELAALKSEPVIEQWSRRQPQGGKARRVDRGAKGGKRGARH